MSGESLPQDNTASGVGNGGARMVACYAALTALAGALWAAFGGASGSSCDECHQAGALVANLPLAWMGVVFYCALAMILAWKGLTPWTRMAFIAACGIHVVLLVLLAWQRLFCGGCLLAGAAAMVGGIASAAARSPSGWLATKVCAAAMLMTIGGILVVRSVYMPVPLAMNTPLAQAGPSPLAPGHVRLVLYEREGCKHCVIFEEEVLPRLVAAMGNSLEIERREPTLDMETPTIIVEGSQEWQFVGVPEYEDLEFAVRRAQ